MAPKKKSKVDLLHLRALVQLEKEPAPLTKEDVKLCGSPRVTSRTSILWLSGRIKLRVRVGSLNILTFVETKCERISPLR
jgi:hypothetical protein